MLKKEGFENVCKLRGGVQYYGNSLGAQHWQGRLFVFDRRDSIAVGNYDEASVVGRCYICGKPCEDVWNCHNYSCNRTMVACRECMQSMKGCCCSLNGFFIYVTFSSYHESLLITSFRWLVFSNHTSHFSSRWDFWRKVPIARILRPFAHLMRTVERDVALVFSYLLPRSKLRTRGGAMTNFAALAWARSTFLMSQSVFFFNCGPRGLIVLSQFIMVYHAYLFVTCFNPQFVTVSFFMLLLVWWPGTPCRPGGVWIQAEMQREREDQKAWSDSSSPEYSRSW